MKNTKQTEQFTTVPILGNNQKLPETKTMRTVARVRDYDDGDLIACGLDAEMNDHLDPSLYGNSWLPCRWLSEFNGFQVYLGGNWQFTQSIDWEFKYIETIGLNF